VVLEERGEVDGEVGGGGTYVFGRQNGTPRARGKEQVRGKKGETPYAGKFVVLLNRGSTTVGGEGGGGEMPPRGSVGILENSTFNC